MRTPLDAFHQALVNLANERRRTEQERTVRRRRRVGVTEAFCVPGTKVLVMIPTNLHGPWRNLLQLDGRVGTIIRTSWNHHDRVEVDFGKSTVTDIPVVFLDLVDPPPDNNNIEDIERWLNEGEK